MSERTEYPSQEELDELQELMERVGESEQRVDKVVRAAAAHTEFYEDMRALYQRRAAQHATKDDYYPYTELDGELMLGADPDGRPVGISRRQLNEHMLVVGRSGAGKTTFFYNVIDTLNRKDIPVLVFDFKNDYRDVADALDVTVVNWRDLKFNPLQPPPGVSDARWAEALAQTWAHAMGFMTLSKSYFLNKLRQLYDLYSSEISDDRYPSLFELRELAAAEEIPYASPRYRAKERTVGRTAMLTGFSGDIFDCSCGHPIPELLEQNVVLELQGPVREAQQFVVETLLTWLFYYREAQGHRGGVRHAVLFDEAKMVFDRQREEDTDIPHPPITALMGRVRAFGEAMVVADHEPSKLSNSLKANTNVKLWMSLGSGHDTEEMAATFGVEDEQVEFTQTLQRGQSVVATAENKPVPVELPPFHVDRTGDAQEGAELDGLAWTERVRPQRFWDAVGGRPPESTSADGDDPGEESVERDVGEVAEALLASIVDEPFLSMSERYDAIDAGAKTGNAAKEELVTLALVEEVEVDTRKPGRNPKFLELTDRGEQVLEDRGYELAATGRRGIEHRYWQQEIKAYYEAEGFDVEVEYGVGQEHIDVYAERDDEQVAVEVARSPEHEVANVEKCLEYGADRVVVASLSESVQKRVEEAVQEAFDGVPQRVAFVSVAEYA